MSSHHQDSSSAGRVRTSRSTNAENKAIQAMIHKGEKELAQRRAERAEARSLRIQNLEEQRQAEDQDDEAQEETPPVAASRRSSRKQELADPLLSPELENLSTKEKCEVLEQKLRSTLTTNEELTEQKMKLCVQVDKMKDKVEDAEQLRDELLEDREFNKRAMVTTEEKTAEQHEELELLCAELVARQQYMEELGIEWPPEHLLNGEEEQSTEGESTCNHTSEDEEAETTTEDDEFSERLTRRPSQQDIKERQKQILLNQVGRLKQEIQSLKQDLEERKADSSNVDTSNAVLARDMAKLLNDKKSKVETAETEQESLTSQVNVLETQVKRLKGVQEESEAVEDELKLDRRKLQRELRQAKNQAEELEVENERLQKRVERAEQRRRF